MSTTREKELARQRAERQAARRAAAAARKRQRTAVVGSVLAVLLVAVGLGVLTAVLSDDSPAGTVAAQPSASAAAPGGCAYPESGEAAKEVDLPPTEGVETEGEFTATLKTSEGDISFTMDAAAAPCTVNSFRSLAHFAYFDDTPCHRLTVPPAGIFVLQCGDPTGTGTGGPGYSFADENLEGATYPRGTVAMANSGPDTNGSQFFLVYQDSPLGPDFTPFGTITEGLDVLDRIAAAGADDPRGQGDGPPSVPVQLDEVRTRPVA